MALKRIWISFSWSKVNRSFKHTAAQHWMSDALSVRQSSWKQPRLHPPIPVPHKQKAVMQPMLTVHPELYFVRANRISLPPCRPRNLRRMLCFKLPHQIHQSLAALQRSALLRNRRSQLTLPGPAVKVSVRILSRKLRYRAIHPHLPPQALPMKAKRRPWIPFKLAPFPASRIRVETESALVHLFHQHHAHAWCAIGSGRCKRRRIRIVRLAGLRLLQPLAKHLYGVSCRL